MTLDFVPTEYDVELADAVSVVCDAWAQGATSPPRQTVSEWADAHRIIAKGAGAEPGPWRTARNPALREIMDSLSDHSPVVEVDFKKSAQIGATEVGINFTCYNIDRGVDSMIVAQPVKDLARSWSMTKFEPAVAEMPALLDKLESDNTLEKQFPGGTLWVIWANSPNQLRQRTSRFIFADEVDEYPRNLAGQGSALQQLGARRLSYGKRAKEYRACTPTIAGISQIAEGFLAGDQRYYMVRCPVCGEHQVLHVDNLQPNGTFACVANGCVIEPHFKTTMLRERSPCAACGERPLRVIDHVEPNGDLAFADDCRCGRVQNPPAPDGAYWEPRNAAADPLHRSYHLWAAYAPEGLGLTWKEIATRKAEADANPEKQAAFQNLVCGETFAGERKEQNSELIAELAEPGVHLGVVPRGSLILTAGIDCQHDRFEITVLGHGRGQRARIVDYVVLDGDPSRPDGYSELDTFLQRAWVNCCHRNLHITSLSIDGGNWSEMVAQWVKSKVTQSGHTRMVKIGDEYRKQAIYLTRGRSEKKSERAVYRPLKSEVNARDKTIAKSVGVWGVGTSVLKHIIFGWLSSAVVAKAEAERSGEAEDIDARMLRFPGGRGEPFDPIRPDAGALPPTYYKGLTCEYFDLEAKQWITPRGARNEPLDTLVYALWASLAPAVKIDTVREPQWAALEAKYEPPQDLFASEPPAPDPKHADVVVTAAADVPRETKKVDRVDHSQLSSPARRGWNDGSNNQRGWGRT